MAQRSKLPRGYFWRGPYIWCRTDPATKTQRSTELSDVKGIKAWRKERERLADDPAYRAANQATLGDWVKETIKAKSVDRSEATMSVYDQKLRHVVRVLGENTPLIKIDAKAGDKYAAARRDEGASDHTIVKEFSALAQLLTLAKRAKCYPHDIEDVKPPNVTPRYVPRKRHLAVDDVPKLIQQCRGRLLAIVSVAIATGARSSEALRFDPANDLDGWVAHLRGKKTKGSDRHIPVLPPFRPLIEACRHLLPVKQYKNNLRRDLLNACKRAGLDPCTMNDLRRTHASLLVSAGVNKDVVRRLLGHSTSAMVDRVYGQVDPQQLAELASGPIQTLMLPKKTATINATIEGAGNKEAENKANNSAPDTTRTYDPRLRKPVVNTLDSSETSINQAEYPSSRLCETNRDTAKSATASATIAPLRFARRPAVDLLRLFRAGVQMGVAL